MSTRCCAACLVLVFVSAAGSDLLACGDKFLVPSRGARLGLTTSAREQARVLLYLNGGSSLQGLATKLSLDPALRKAGYRATVAASSDEISRMLRQDTWDVVLLDVNDGALAADAHGAPAIIAVATNQKDSDLASARKQYATVLKSPKRSQSFVDALDAAVAARRSAQAKAASNRK